MAGALPPQIQLAIPIGREWIVKRRENVRPWLVFFQSSKFKPPPNVPKFKTRVKKNIDYFQSNYAFVFLFLIIYCLITSPLLILAIAGSLGICSYLSHRNIEKKMIIKGQVISLAQQYAGVAVMSMPMLWIVGAGHIIFWLIGANFFVIALHTTMYDIEAVLGSDDNPFDTPVGQVSNISTPDSGVGNDLPQLTGEVVPELVVPSSPKPGNITASDGMGVTTLSPSEHAESGKSTPTKPQWDIQGQGFI